MNAAHIHLMLNHVPLFGAVAVTILLVVALFLRQQGVARAGLVVALLTALVAVVVYLTGEPAEELVENLPGISEAAMETHEEIALVATLVLGAFAIVALYGLFAFRHGVSMGFTRVLLILSLFPLATMAYTAYQLSLHGKPAPVIGGLTGDQRFFLAFGQIWKGKYRDESLLNLIKTNPHSPGMYRANGPVRNFDPWYRALDVKPGDALYLPPEKRVRIW